MAEMRLMIPQPLRLMVPQTLLLAHPSAKLVARLRPFLPPTAVLAIMPVLKLVLLLRHLLFVRFRRPHHYHADRLGTAVRSRKMIPTALLSVVLLRARRCINLPATIASAANSATDKPIRRTIVVNNGKGFGGIFSTSLVVEASSSHFVVVVATITPDRRQRSKNLIAHWVTLEKVRQ